MSLEPIWFKTRWRYVRTAVKVRHTRIFKYRVSEWRREKAQYDCTGIDDGELNGVFGALRLFGLEVGKRILRVTTAGGRKTW